jgi:protease-4
MKGFLKITLASILGVLIAFFLFVMLISGIVGSLAAEKPLVVEPNTILLASFDKPVTDRHPESPFSSLSSLSLSPEMGMGLDMILENIAKAKDDENIKGILLDLSGVNAGIASVGEIRSALVAFRDSGKFIIAHADAFTQSSYYLATAADKVYMTPEGELLFLGLSAEPLFFKRALDKLGIDARVIRHGEYKSAGEMFMYEKLSKENRDQIYAYISSIWDEMLLEISQSRNIPVEELNRLADNLLVSNAASALENKFVDGLKYQDELIAELKELTGTEEKDDLKAISLAKYDKAPKARKGKGLAKNKIAVVYASGNIVMGEGQDGIIGSDDFSKAIRKARRDSTVKAIVLRINSGGGSALASEVIWREVKLAAEVKPVIASMGDVAASGGYYIAAPATKIYANPNTITGSIGVFGLIPNMKKFMNDKLGITSDVVTTNRHSDMMTILRPLEDKEADAIQSEIGRVYDTFITHVAEGRKMSKEAVDKIGRGHVYSAVDAKSIGLVDELGGLTAAVEAAAKEAGLDSYRIVKYPELEDPFQKIISEMTGQARVKHLKEALGEYYQYSEILKEVGEMKGVQARLPYVLNIK